MKKKEKNTESDVVEGVSDTNVLTTSIDNTSTDKSGILDADSAVHVCSQKKMFNSLVEKEEGTINIVDSSACKAIDTRTINVTGRDEMMRALEVVRYVPGVRYNLIFIGVLDEE